MATRQQEGELVPATLYYDKDATLDPITGKTIAIVGYGSQGHAHAQNLRDSGMKVVVGLAEGSKSRAKAEADGFEVLSVADAATRSDLIMILAPDQVQGKIYEQSVKSGLTAGKTLLFAHGFAIRFGLVTPPADVNVVMVAPKAPGHRFRELFQEGAGVPGLVAVEQDATGNAKKIALAYAKGLGLTRAGVIETTFTEECETDLFGEQAVLCGGITEMIQAGFQTLVKAGYQPEIAYFECLHEVKLIVDQIYENGISYMLYSVSDTAEYGAYYAGPKVIDAHVRANMQELLDRVQDGTFARQWIEENESGRANFLQMRSNSQNSQIETVGKGLRAMMPWLHKGKTPVDISA
jgi:ketol-acid reductoisomerase